VTDALAPVTDALSPVADGLAPVTRTFFDDALDFSHLVSRIEQARDQNTRRAGCMRVVTPPRA
jgi:hypothetical protein